MPIRRKTLVISLGALVVLIVVLVLGAVFVLRQYRESETGYKKMPLSTPNAKFELLVAGTYAQRELGLGNRSGLPANKGMLFPYDQESKPCFWMRGMRFPVDMIWLDKSKTVVDVAANVKPGTFPQAFCPKQPAQYVIELNANAAAKSGVTVGKQLQF